MAIDEQEWRAVRWPIVLDAPPDVVQAGVGMHSGPQPERFYMPDFWCFHLYLYQASVRLGAQRFPIRPGFVGIIPPNTPIEYQYQGPSRHLFVHFRCPDPGPPPHGRDVVWIPAMQDLGADFPRLYEQLEEVIRGVSQPRYRTQARVWDLLCQLTQRQAAAPHGGALAHPAVQHTIQRVELRLGEPLTVADLARRADVSPSYLARLFREAFGVTVAGYIRARRIQRAEHLLLHSTLPVKMIATTVGIPDLHFFNKAVHQALGASPRAVRAGRKTEGA